MYRKDGQFEIVELICVHFTAFLENDTAWMCRNKLQSKMKLIDVDSKDTLQI